MPAYQSTIEYHPNGSYIWTCSIEPEYYRRNMGLGLRACAGIAVFLLIFGAFLSFPSRDYKSFLIFLGCTAVFLLITFAVFRLAYSVKDPKEHYEMWEQYVKSGSGRSSVFFDYRKARTAVFSRKYIKLKGRIGKIRTYVPEGDLDFVRSYIQIRLPGSCDIKYQ